MPHWNIPKASAPDNELLGILEAREVSQFGHHGHSDRELDAPEGLESLDDGLEAPGVHLLMKVLF